MTVRFFFCEGVMAIVRYLREHTKGTAPGATHHVFKILAKYAVYGDRGRVEVAGKGRRMDIIWNESLPRKRHSRGRTPGSRSASA